MLKKLMMPAQPISFPISPRSGSSARDPRRHIHTHNIVPNDACNTNLNHGHSISLSNTGSGGAQTVWRMDRFGVCFPEP